MNKWDRIRQQNPEWTPLLVQGVWAWRQGRRAAARRLLAQAVRQNPHNATAWYWLGRAVEHESQWQECRARMQQLDQKRPTPAHRHPPRKRLAPVVGLIAVIMLVCAATTPPRSRAVQTLTASGSIYARQVDISSEYGGRIAEVLVSEGDRVAAGDPLIRLDTSTLDAQIAVAQAAVALAEAGLAQVRAGARPGQVSIAQAQLVQAQTACLVARQAVSDTVLLRQNPQDIQLQMAVVQAQIESSEYKLARALALKDAAEIGKERFEDAMRQIGEYGGPGPHRIRIQVAEGSWNDIWSQLPPELRDLLPGPPADGVYTWGDYELHVQGGHYILYRWVTIDLYLPLEAHLAPNYWWQAWIGVNAAAAEKEGRQAALEQLAARQQDPQNLQAQIDRAVAARAQAQAQVTAAQAQVDGLQAGATPQQIAALEARVAQARAALDSLLTQRSRMELTAPMDGMVVSLSVRPGEVATAGATLLLMADLTHVQLKVYLPQTEIGRVRVGQSAQVQVDTFPGQTFTGQVAYISQTAEFTPRNVATQEERVNLVFAIEITLDNPDGRLKPGMSADAVLSIP